MPAKEEVYRAAQKLAMSKPYDQITFVEIAAEAGVHWTAVRRHLGNKEELRRWLLEIQQQELDGGPLADTRTRIMEAAEAVFAVQGYHQASLEKVATAAGLTKGAVYWHFANKQDLYLAMMEKNLSMQLQQLPLEIEQLLGASDPEASLTMWLKSQFDCLQTGDGGSMLFLEFVTSSREPEIRDRLQALYGKSLEAIGDFLTQMQQRGYLSSDLDAKAVGIIVDAMIKGVVIQWLIDPIRCDLNKLLPTIAKVLWSGIAPIEYGD